MRWLPGRFRAHHIDRSRRASHLLVFGHRQVEPRPSRPPLIRSGTWRLSPNLCHVSAVYGRAGAGRHRPGGAAGRRARRRTTEVTGQISLSAALSHSAGFPAHRPFYAQALGPRGQGAGTESSRAAVVQAARPASRWRIRPVRDRSTRTLGSSCFGTSSSGGWDAGSIVAAADVFAPLGSPRSPIGPSANSARGLHARRRATGHRRHRALSRCAAASWSARSTTSTPTPWAAWPATPGLFGDAAGVAHPGPRAVRRLPGRAAGGRRAAAGRSRRAAPVLDARPGVPGSTWRLGWDGPAASGRWPAIASRARRSGTWPSPAARSGSIPSARSSCWCSPTASTPRCATIRAFRELRRALNDAALARSATPPGG